MKILLISYYYKHKNAMASVRAIKLAKYFSRLGHEVTVLTSNQVDTWTKSYNEPIPDENIREIYAPEDSRWTFIGKYLAKRKARGVARLQSKAAAPAPSAAPSAKRSLKARLRSYLSWLFYFNIAKQEDICMFRGLKREFKKSINEKFDAVVATYPTNGAFMMGRWLKAKGYCRTLVADFRDPLYNPGFRDRAAEARFDIKCLRKIVSAADKITCVSEGIAEGIREMHPKSKAPIRVITNGFDYDDVKTSQVEVDFDKSKINFVYAGALYHGKRCVNMLAEALCEMLRSGKIKENSFVFHYAGSDFSELLEQLKEYGLEGYARDWGFVSREKSISMQKNASALLLLTWNESSYKGVVPGKLFEYMSTSVPIIALITGDVAGSEVAEMIRTTGAGYAAEEAAPEDKAGLAEFIEALFEHRVLQDSKTDLYSYENISLQYIDFLKEN